MKEFFSLFLSRVYITKNSIISIRSEPKLKVFLISTFIIGLLLGEYFIFWEGFSYLLGFSVFGCVLVDRLLSLFLMFIFWMLLFSNIIVSYSTVYASKEIDLAMSLPVRSRAIFANKFLESFFYSSWAFILVIVPVFLSYGVVKHAGLFFYFTSLSFVIPFLIIPAVIGTILTMLLVRFFMARKVITYLVVIATGVVLSLTFIYRLIKLGVVGRVQAFPMIDQILDAVQFCNFPFMPSYWMMTGMCAGNFTEYIFYWFVTVSTALFGIQVLLSLSSRIFYSGWCNLKSSLVTKIYPMTKGILNKSSLFLKFLPNSIKSLVIKDIKVFCRDPKQWTQFVIFFGLLGIYVLNLRNSGYQGVLALFWKNMVIFLNLTSIGLILSTLTTRFMFPLLSLEGARYWITGLAPISLKKILLEKFWIGTIVSLVLTEGLIIGSNIMIKPTLVVGVVSCAVVFMMSFALNGISIGLGAVFPNFKVDDPARIVSGIGGTLCFILNLVYICISIGIVAIPIHLYFVKHVISASLFKIFMLGAIVFVLILTCTAIVLPLYLGYKSLKNADF